MSGTFGQMLSTQGTNFNIWGMPFFTEKKRQIFDAAIKESLEIL